MTGAARFDALEVLEGTAPDPDPGWLESLDLVQATLVIIAKAAIAITGPLFFNINSSWFVLFFGVDMKPNFCLRETLVQWLCTDQRRLKCMTGR